jgi:DNA-binding Lrp family transcriptional regulator
MRTISEKSADFLTKLAPFIESDGARNWNQISREMPIPYQTLRDRMKGLKEDGMRILALPDVEKIGLERVRGSFRLSKAHVNEIKSFFAGLHESAGLRTYARLLLNYFFECEFLIPKGSIGELANFLNKLEEMGYIEDPKINSLLWKDFLRLKTEFYDYSKKEWGINFSALSSDPSSFEIPKNSEPVRFDYCDLLMIKELELDSWIKSIEIAKNIGLAFGDTIYHLNNHVFARKLIKGFRLRWDGTREAWLKHSIVLANITFPQISDDDLRHAISVLVSTPFVWSHMRTEDGSYLAELAFPIAQFPDILQQISSKLVQLGLAPELSLKDWSCMSSFTIPYLLYDRERSRWEFSAENALEGTLQLVKTAYSN